MSLIADPVSPDAAARRPGGAAALAVALTAHPELWAPRVRYREHSRWTSLLDPADAAAVLDPGLHAELAGAQIWLLSWLPGQGTDLHDHGGSAGAFAVARGSSPSGWSPPARGTACTSHHRPARRPGAPLRPAPRPPGDQHAATSRRSACTSTRRRCADEHLPRSTAARRSRTGTERAGVDW